MRVGVTNPQTGATLWQAAEVVGTVSVITSGVTVALECAAYLMDSQCLASLIVSAMSGMIAGAGGGAPASFIFDAHLFAVEFLYPPRRFE